MATKPPTKSWVHVEACCTFLAEIHFSWLIYVDFMSGSTDRTFFIGPLNTQRQTKSGPQRSSNKESRWIQYGFDWNSGTLGFSTAAIPCNSQVSPFWATPFHPKWLKRCQRCKYRPPSSTLWLGLYRSYYMSHRKKWRNTNRKPTAPAMNISHSNLLFTGGLPNAWMKQKTDDLAILWHIWIITNIVTMDNIQHQLELAIVHHLIYKS